MEFFQCTSLQDARELIRRKLAHIKTTVETVALPEALGRVAAENLAAAADLPPFNRSTVDGFAVRSADTFGAAETLPALFAVIGEVLMGQPANIELLPGQAAIVPTGGMLPKAADAVVMIEHTEILDEENVLVLQRTAPGENVISRGEDVKSGAALFVSGQKLASRHIGLLAACGITRLSVSAKIKVGIISTGDELVDIDQPLQYGQIRDINSYALAAMLEEEGCRVERLGIIRDSYEQFFACLQQAVAVYQLVIISGGSSVGVRDFTVKAIGALGQPGLLFHGISVKPGKPTIFGLIDDVPVFGLPGHPVAAMIVCRQLIQAAVRQLAGQQLTDNELPVLARLTRNIASAPGRDDFINVSISRVGGEYRATPVLGKSGLIRLMADSDGLLHIPADKSGLYEGELVAVRGIRN